MTTSIKKSLFLATTLALGLTACATSAEVPLNPENQDSWCRSSIELAATARAALVKDGLFVMEDFDFDADGTLEIGDINGDQVDDLLVLPGVNYVANQETTVFLSVDGKQCDLKYAGTLGGASSVRILSEESKLEVKELEVSNVARAGCDLELITYYYDASSERFIGDLETVTNEDLCDEDSNPEADAPETN